MGQRRVASRAAQWPLLAEFVANWDDTMVDKTGVVRDFKTPGGPFTFVVIPLPPGAIIEGGEVANEGVFTGATGFTVGLGDSGNAARYLAGTDVKGAGRTPIVPTGYVSQGENIEMVLTVAGTASAGKVSVRVWYVIRDRANEVNPV
jgi:hypothetical protein